MLFSPEQVEQLQVDYETVAGKYTQLLPAFAFRRYNVGLARDHAVHGFCRRLKVLVRCIDNIFRELPPHLDRLPTSDELADANINLQAFIFNVFGCVDNLAWIWVCERKITTEQGRRIPKEWIGLRRQNQKVRASFSPEFRAILDGFDEWFGLNEEYRHAVAHRVPLYVPPYAITPANEAAHHDLEGRRIEAFNRGAFDEHDRMSEEQDALGVFHPIMTHSIREGARSVVFHPQMINDFSTIDALGWALIAELDRE